MDQCIIWGFLGYIAGMFATFLILMFLCKPTCGRDEHEDGPADTPPR